jgi:chromatin remodeling complex protein RSC6
MDAMLRLIRMDTTLPGLMSMPILDPMSMPILLGIIFPIITPIEREVKRNTPLETSILVHARLRALHGSGV